ncbi:MAG: hypothetical protein KI785_07025 [Devosiaceae bacterium]|nr:hypothetical protein [Devosiaceae bacterium MH13]
MTRLSRDDLRGKVQTVTGLIEPDALGQTLMHEHLIWDIRLPDVAAREGEDLEITLSNCWRVNYGRKKIASNMVSRSVDLAIEEVGHMVAAGGKAIVELSSGGLRPDPDGLAEIATSTGAHVIAGCGHYVNDYQDPANHDRSIDDFAAEMVDQVFEGSWGTDVRAGIIGEIGCQSPWTDLEKRVMNAAIIAQKETGASLNIHPGRDADQPQEVMDFIAEHDGLPERTIISHIDRTIFDDDELFRLADTGCIIEYDLFGQETTYYPWNPDIDMPNDGMRLKHIRKLIDRGHLEQVVISHDICYLTRLTAYGGHGYWHIFENVIPHMRTRGFSEHEITMIMEGTPQRLLTFI